jgi:hypothetical protein
MRIEVEKSSGRSKCRNRTCKKLPEYINSSGRIKNGSTCISIRMESAAGFNTSYYCRDCIEEIHLTLKAKLNPIYWNFE